MKRRKPGGRGKRGVEGETWLEQLLSALDKLQV
jgi:hypothetical protein